MLQRKIAGLLVIALLAAIGLSVRLFGIAVFQHQTYVAEAEQRQLVETNVQPQRGSIWFQDAATGQPDLAAQSTESYSVSATPRNVAHKQEYAALLAKFTGVDEASILASFTTNSGYMDPIKQGLSKTQVDQLAAQINTLEEGLNKN